MSIIQIPIISLYTGNPLLQSQLLFGPNNAKPILFTVQPEVLNNYGIINDPVIVLGKVQFTVPPNTSTFDLSSIIGIEYILMPGDTVILDPNTYWYIIVLSSSPTLNESGIICTYTSTDSELYTSNPNVSIRNLATLLTPGDTNKARSSAYLAHTTQNIINNTNTILSFSNTYQGFGSNIIELSPTTIEVVNPCNIEISGSVCWGGDAVGKRFVGYAISTINPPNASITHGGQGAVPPNGNTFQQDLPTLKITASVSMTISICVQQQSGGTLGLESNASSWLNVAEVA